MDSNNQDNFKDENNKNDKKSLLIDLLIGLGISILIFAAIIATFSINNAAIISIVELIIISFSTFLAVKFIRKDRRAIGTLILITVIPMTLLLLLIGSCAISYGSL